MKAIVTGLNGTVGPVLGGVLKRNGHEVAGWSRASVHPDDLAGVRAHIWREKPDSIFHLAMGSPAWAAEIARACRDLCIRFLFTSTVSVYAHTQAGPHRPSDQPEPNDDYGRYKRECENAIMDVNPEAVIARIGWQIGEAPGGNNMLSYFDQHQREHGKVALSRRWVPACSFLHDTASVLAGLVEERIPGGLYHVQGNRGLDICEIAKRLKARHRSPWEIVETHDFKMDNRMVDERIDQKYGSLLDITRHLPEL